MRERMESSGKPLARFGETYRTAFGFLANPCNLWNSDRIEDRRAVLKLVFADRRPYVRGKGYRTAEISMPFKLLGSLNMTEKEIGAPGRTRTSTLLPATDFESVSQLFSHIASSFPWYSQSRVFKGLGSSRLFRKMLDDAGYFAMVLPRCFRIWQ
jgi:hypothetical protein